MHTAAIFAQQQPAPTDYTPAIIAACVALVGILVAAWTAQKRLRVQLDHDRELHDLGELRTVVDEAAALTYTALDKLTDAMAAAEDWAIAGQSGVKEAVAAAAARHEAFVVIWPMENMAARLALRLTEQHPVYTAFQEFHHGCKQAARQMPLKNPPDPILEPDRWAALRAELRRTRVAYVRQAHEVVASRLPPPTPTVRAHPRLPKLLRPSGQR